MDNLSLRKLKMYHDVQSVFNTHKQKWESSVPFKTEVETMDATVTAIEDKDKMLKGSESVSEEKLQTKELLLDTTLVICGVGIAYAAQIKDAGLKAMFNFTKSDLKEGNEKEIYTRCVGIGKAAEPILDKLLPFNLPPDQLTVQAEAASAFDKLIPAPREARTADKSIKEEMKILFKECDTLLNVRLDNMMLVYRKSYPDFYLEYTNARQIGGWSKGKGENAPMG